MKYLSVCSGIEAASAAWHDFGWTPVGFAEIEPFPSAVLAHRFPSIPNFGDMTKYKEWPIDRNTHRHDELQRGPQLGGAGVWTTGRPDVHDHEGPQPRSGDSGGNNASETRYGNAPDILVGGPPCQAFSVAGKRGGLADARGNLTLTYCDLADHFSPDWIIYENVPGLLSSKDNAFGCLLAGLSGAEDECRPTGKRWSDAGVVSGSKRTVAWRILDAQFFGLAQRRRRFFVLAVPGSGNWACAQALFSIGEGLRRDFAAGRKEGKESPAGAGQGTAGSHWDGEYPHFPLDRRNGSPGYFDQKLFSQGGASLVPEYYESHPADSRITGPHDIGNTVSARYGTGGNTPLVSGTWWDGGQIAQTLDAVLQKGQTMPEKNRFPAVMVPVLMDQGGGS